MVLAKGEKIMVITRRRFENDLRRHFIGEVVDVSETIVRVKGYAFVFDLLLSEFVKDEGHLTRVYPLIDADLVYNVLPREVNIEQIRYTIKENQQHVVTDGYSFEINVSEFGLKK